MRRSRHAAQYLSGGLCVRLRRFHDREEGSGEDGRRRIGTAEEGERHERRGHDQSRDVEARR
ncbi:hypothetical protein [Nonomuraea longicatena]|uniref:Uncharacterized protein n=1 Tax=Nonomuraea longicatena TaxID=83682 RepID=A0ABN1R9W0_9ACTN